MTNGERALYPFQVYGFFIDQTSGEKMGIGKMGLRKMGQTSELVEKWTMEDHFRVVNLQTIHQPVFALKFTKECYLDSDKRVAKNQVLFLRDRIGDWPVIFNSVNWQIKKEPKKKQNKRQKVRN